MIPFRYIEFYDVPRTILLRVRDKWLLLQSAFDEERDGYAPNYSVYLLPPSFEPPPSGESWGFLTTELELDFLGEIPVQEVEFDPTTRQSLSAPALARLVPD